MSPVRGNAGAAHFDALRSFFPTGIAGPELTHAGRATRITVAIENGFMVVLARCLCRIVLSVHIATSPYRASSSNRHRHRLSSSESSQGCLSCHPRFGRARPYFRSSVKSRRVLQSLSILDVASRIAVRQPNLFSTDREDLRFLEAFYHCPGPGCDRGPWTPSPARWAGGLSARLRYYGRGPTPANRAETLQKVRDLEIVGSDPLPRPARQG